MPRPTWTPTTPEETAALAAIRRAARIAKEAEDALWKKVKAARALNIPAERAASEAGHSKATLYRRLGTDDAPEAGPPAGKDASDLPQDHASASEGERHAG